MTDDSRNVAVLIDFENLNESELLEAVLERSAKYGRVVVKSAIGNFSAIGDNGQQLLQQLGIQTVHQSTAGKGKNSSDMRMAIEAANLFHDREKSIDVFVLATSDVDFLPLAQWLRASGKHVVGAGRSDASIKWQTGVDEFVILKEVKVAEASKSAEPKSTSDEAAKSITKAQPQKPKQLTRKYKSLVNRTVHELFKDGIDSVTDGQFNAQIRKLDSDFSCKKAGFPSLRKLIASVETLYVPPEPKTGAFNIQLRDRNS